MIDVSNIIYHPDTGKIDRIKKTSNNCKMQDICQSQGNGYTHISIHNKKELSHRVAFAYMGVEIPENMQVDHINGVRDDNRWSNLRIVTRNENSLNRASKNVYLDKRKGSYYVQIVVNKKVYYKTAKNYEHAVKQRAKLIEELGIGEIKCREE